LTTEDRNRRARGHHEAGEPPQSLHLHIVSGPKSEVLTKIVETVRSQHADVRIIEHLHPLVRSRRQLHRVLKEVEAAPGIVIHSLSNQTLAERLEEACQHLKVPCIAGPKADVNKKPELSWRTRAIILSLLGTFLVFEVATKSLAAFLAEASPETVRFLSTNPTALVNMADAKIEAGQEKDTISDGRRSDQAEELGLDREDRSSAQGADRGIDSKAGASFQSGDSPSRAEIRGWLESALRKDPLNARAFRLLGQVAEGDPKEQQRFMEAAARRSLHERVAVYWMMRQSYEDQDYAASLRYADILLRVRPDLLSYAMPILGKIAEHERTSANLQKLLAANPPWRPAFFHYLPGNILDALTPLEILLSLKDTSNPPSSADLEAYLGLLTRKGFYDLAYYTWLQFLPAKQLAKVGLLFNGDFEVPSSGLPFDWTFVAGSGVAIEVAERPDKDSGHVLKLRFGPGRVSRLGVSQLVTLQPGTYRFKGRHNADVVSERGLLWRISCAGKKPTKLGESSPVARGAVGGWQPFSFSFKVPDEGCPAQLVQLAFDARSASEQFISGSIEYDDLQIEREPATVRP
jgi:hypothetical protein